MPSEERKAAVIVREIETRVRPTICPTFSARGGEPTIEGRISAEDFDTLVTLAGAASFLHRAIEPS